MISINKFIQILIVINYHSSRFVLILKHKYQLIITRSLILLYFKNSANTVFE
jgi:hypothetical protein